MDNRVPLPPGSIAKMELTSAPCNGPMLFTAENLTVYHAVENPHAGAEHSHDDVQLAFTLDRAFYAATESVAASGPQDVFPGSVLLTASQERHRIVTAGDTELGVLWLPSVLLDESADDLSISVTGQDLAGGRVRDALLQHVATSVVAALAKASTAPRLYIDSAANLLAAYLLMHHTADSRQRHGVLPPLSLPSRA